MGQKVSPVGLRIGVNKDWESKWFATKDYATYLHEDIKIRELLNKSLKEAVISKIEIEKTKDSVVVNVSALKPAVILGQDGNTVKELSKKVSKIAHGKNVKRAYIRQMSEEREETTAKVDTARGSDFKRTRR